MARWKRLGSSVALALALAFAGSALAAEPAARPQSPLPDRAPAALPPAESSASQGKQAAEPAKVPHECPKGAYLNCMPPVGPEIEAFCSRAYIDWAKAHCPHFEVVN
ncbi:MAG TPA: hypothetical protein VMF53_12040 [Alphaproteobacteria bacterium]|nr:hypothetical protein [Alphaproteobacteria bacterium]